MTVTFQMERLADLLKEPALKELILSHYAESADDDVDLPPNPDWPRLLKHERRGLFKVWTARDGNQLIGYRSYYLEYYPLSKTLGASDGPYYLDPEYREGVIGYKLMFGAEPLLKDRGVRRVISHFPLATYQTRGGLMPLFERAGYKPYEVRLAKKL